LKQPSDICLVHPRLAAETKNTHTPCAVFLLMESETLSSSKWLCNVVPSSALYGSLGAGTEASALFQEARETVGDKLDKGRRSIQSTASWTVAFAYGSLLAYAIQLGLSLAYDYPNGTAIFVLAVPCSILFAVAIESIMKLPNMVDFVRPDFMFTRLLLLLATLVVVLASVVLSTLQVASFCATGSSQRSRDTGYKFSCDTGYAVHIVACVLAYVNLVLVFGFLICQIRLRQKHRAYMQIFYDFVARKQVSEMHKARLRVLLYAMGIQNAELNSKNNYDTSKFVAFFYPVTSAALEMLDQPDNPSSSISRSSSSRV